MSAPRVGDCKITQADGSTRVVKPYSTSALKKITASKGSVSVGTRISLFRRDKGHCRYCYASLTPGTWVPVFIVPVALGGTNMLDNLVVSCTKCKKRKGRKVWEPRPVFGTRRKR